MQQVPMFEDIPKRPGYKVCYKPNKKVRCPYCQGIIVRKFDANNFLCMACGKQNRQEFQSYINEDQKVYI